MDFQKSTLMNWFVFFTKLIFTQPPFPLPPNKQIKDKPEDKVGGSNFLAKTAKEARTYKEHKGARKWSTNFPVMTESFPTMP